MSQYLIVTVSNRVPREWYYLQREFYKSIEGYESITIDYTGLDTWKGLATKPKWLYRAIKEGAIPQDIIIFTDSWDLVFAANPHEILTRWESFGADIVISAERNCFPVDYKENYDKLESPTPYKYLNSGFIVGYKDAILACLEHMDLENVLDDHWDAERNCNYHSNDQTMWQKIFLEQPVKIELDRYQALSQTLHDAKIEEFDFSNKSVIVNKITNSMPCTIHFNGSSKDNMSIRQPILTHLGL